MKINQIAELVGITSKNIRFYEDQGLIKPGRNPENGYREYSMDDVEQLSRIRLLRQLGVPCEKIRQMQTGELDFDSCMAEHIAELDMKSVSIDHMKEMCRLLANEVDDISEIKASVYLEKMRELERGGASFVNIKMSDVRKRRTGAIASALAVITAMLLLVAAVIWANSEDPAPAGVLAVVIAIAALIIAGVCFALRQRLDEVKKGEIDEASKY